MQHICLTKVHIIFSHADLSLNRLYILQCGHFFCDMHQIDFLSSKYNVHYVNLYLEVEIFIFDC